MVKAGKSWKMEAELYAFWRSRSICIVQSNLKEISPYLKVHFLSNQTYTIYEPYFMNIYLPVFLSLLVVHGSLPQQTRRRNVFFANILINSVVHVIIQEITEVSAILYPFLVFRR